MYELELTDSQLFFLIVGLLVVLGWLIVHLGHFQLDTERLEKPEGKATRPLENERYGAYIQLQGKYYN